MSLEQITQEIQALRVEVKSIAKMCRKIQAKQNDPDGSIAAERAKTNGFNRPNDISEKLTAFLGVEPGTQMSRSDVTKFVNAYIADKNLKAPPPNGRNIVLDDKLRDLLEPGEQQVTFLNLQRFLSKHIIKKSA
jgi:upstream activation factor subunit UAF30